VCYCMRCTALVLLDVAGSGRGALRCGCEHCEGYCSTFQENKDRVLLHTVCCAGSATATSHIQHNQRSTPYAVTHGLCSPEDGHNDARNMLRQC